MADEAKYRVGMGSKMTGLSTHTLRMWEKRYATVLPKRTEAGGRLYTDADIERLRLLHKLVQSGHSIGGIAKLPDSDLRHMVAGSQSDRELLRYCYRVAGTVGLMMCSVLRVRDPRAWRHAIDLGIAMQLTNISRDVLEDAQASRVYLPTARLNAYGVDANDLIQGEADPHAVGLVVDEVLGMPDGYYRSADEGMRFLPTRARWAILVASRLYQGIGRRLRRRHQSNPMLGRVVVPWSEKLALVVGATGMWLRLTVRPPRAAHRKQLREHLDGLPYAGS